MMFFGIMTDITSHKTVHPKPQIPKLEPRPLTPNPETGIPRP